MKKCYTIALLCLISAITVNAQTRYWVGPSSGTEGVWNNTTYWSATSGGAGGASVPNGASFDVIFNQGAAVRVDIASLTLNSIKVTNNSTALLYTGAATTITVNSTSAAAPAIDVDAGSTLRDSITAAITFVTTFASNAKGEIDGDWRLGGDPALGGGASVYFDANASGAVVNVNSTGRVLIGAAGGATGTASTLNFNAGSFLVFERNGGFTPTANFATTSTIRILGNTTNVTVLSGSPAVVGNLEIDLPNLSPATANLQLNNGTIIKGNFSILNTNGKKLFLTTSPIGASPVVVNVQGNMTVSGNSIVTIANNTNRPVNFDVDGSFTQSGGTISLQDNNGAAFATTLFVGGHFTQTAGNFTVGSTATNASDYLYVVELNGTSNQNVSVSSQTIDNSSNQVALRINNAAGATLLTPLAVGRVNFVNGKITTTNTNLLTINNTSSLPFTINGVSDNSFVNGPVKRKMAEIAHYAFPVGKGTNYRIFEVAPSTTTPSEFTVEYFATNHPDPDVVLPVVGRSTAEWWNVVRNTGSNASVRLTLEGAVPGSNAGMEILVVRYNGGAWQSERGSTGITTYGDATSGTVTSHVMPNFGPFTFGYGPFGALPIKLTEFDATKASGYNNIHWKAECTSTQAAFEIERSTDGQNFKTIETIVADQVRCLQPFDYQDRTATAGTNYYRLKVKDIDGNKSFYSRIVAVINKAKGFELVGIYPTVITQGQLKINVTAANKDKAELYITNVNGQVLKRMQVSVNPGENVIYVDVASLAAGVYHVTGINSEGQTKTLRFVRQ